MSAPLLSIVIVTYGRREVTERCLQSLEACVGERLGDAVQLILVDNASPDDTLALFADHADRAQVVALSRNHDFAGGCNAGAALATAPVIVFLNNDTIVRPGVLEELAAEVTERGAGAAGPRLLYLDGTIQHAGVAMIQIPGGPPVPHHLFHHQAGELAATRVDYALDAVTGACLAVDRSLFERLGGFDTGYRNGWEDVDLCLRIRCAEREVRYRGDLWLWHDEGQTRGEVRGIDANAQRFYGRWGALLVADDALVSDVFGARLPRPPATAPDGADADVVLRAQVSGLGGDAAEARGLLAALGAAGRTAAVREPVGELVVADLDDRERAALEHAQQRSVAADAVEIGLAVGDGREAASIVRLSPDGAGTELAPTTIAWTATPAARDRLVAAGHDPRLAHWLAPCVPTGAPGPGGGGLACLLPAHDLAASLRTLDALRSLVADGIAVTVLLSATGSRVRAAVAERLPGAELLGPCGESSLRAHAGAWDAFHSADVDDRFERSALIAAGAGAAVVTRHDGAAQAVLGELGDTTSTPGDALARLWAALRRPRQQREARARAVSDACSTTAGAARIARLLPTRERDAVDVGSGHR